LSILSKIFVVLVTILSVALVAMVVPFVAKTEMLREQLRELEGDKQVADYTAASRQQEVNLLRQGESERNSRLTAESLVLKNQITELATQVGKADADARSAREQSGRLQSDLSRLVAAEQQHADINKSLSDELTLRRKELVTQQTKNIQLADANNSLQAERETLDRQVRRFAEQITLQEDEIAKLEKTLSRVPADIRNQLAKGEDEVTTSATFEPETPIRGLVNKVQKVDDSVFIEISVGVNDGVTKNMKFLVHRGNKFLGTLVITAVDAKAAAGKMQFAQEDVVAGDAVLAGGF